MDEREEDRLKVLHYIPCYQQRTYIQVAHQCVYEAAALSQQDIRYQPWWTDGHDIASMRNHALGTALGENFDYICMQDSDVYSPGTEGAISRLVESAQSHGAALTAAICGLRWTGTETINPNVKPFDEGIYEAERAGTGLVLIDCVQVKAWDYDGPWFARTYTTTRQTKIDYGEDFFFSALCQQQCAKIIVDSRIETKHVYTDHERLHYTPKVTRA